MRGTITPVTLFVLSSFILPSSSLPLNLRNLVWIENLARRYSVVAVDGSSPIPSPPHVIPATVTKTILSTVTPTASYSVVDISPLTVTVDVPESTSIPQIKSSHSSSSLDVPSTARYPSSSSKASTTSLPAFTPSLAQVSPTTTPVSTLAATNASAGLVHSETSSRSNSTAAGAPTAPASSPTLSFPPVASASSSLEPSSPPSQYTMSLSTTRLSSRPTSTSYTGATEATTRPSSFNVSAGHIPTWATSITSSPTSTSTGLPYDNGQWHTIYPPWSNTTLPSALVKAS